MSNVREFPGHDRTAVGEACEWLARVERGLTVEERQALLEWGDASPENLKAFRDAALLWDKMDSLSRLADLFPKPEQQQPSKMRTSMAMAASVLLAASIGLYVIASKSLWPDASTEVVSQTQLHVFETAVGEQSTVRLLDGSELTLNTNSRVAVDFGKDERKLVLYRGEVYVDVAHDEARSLTLQAGDRLVRAIGTEFSVEITQDDRVELIVTEGKVVVGVLRAQASTSDQSGFESSSTEAEFPVSAGEKVLFGEGGLTLEAIEADEIDVSLSWRGGNLVFRGESLATALDEIGRYTEIEFVIVDEELKARKIVGLFRAGDVEGLLQSLTENFNIAYEREEDGTIILDGN